MDNSLKIFLDSHKISYLLHTHPAVYTVDEAEIHYKNKKSLSCKNLFLKNEKGDYFLLVMPAKKKLDIKEFTKITASKKMRFASEEELNRILNLSPGSVSPFGLINDSDAKSLVYIDKDVWDAKQVMFHPNINTETIEINQEDFWRFIQGLNNKYFVVDLNLR